MNRELKETRRRALRLLGGAAAAAVVALSTFAHAQPTTASVELVVLHGVKDGSNSYPPGYPELTKAPWDAYDHYTVLSTKSLALTKGSAVNETLPNSWTIETTLLDITPPTYKLRIVVKDEKGVQKSSGTYPMAKGVRVLPARIPHGGGGMVPAFKVL